MLGRPATGTNGFGHDSVCGRSRVPFPPAMMIMRFDRLGGVANSSHRCRPTTR